MTRRPPTRSGAVFNRRDVQSLQRVFVLCDDRQAGFSRQPDKDALVSAAANVPDHAWRGRVQSVERAFALLDAIAAGSPRGSTVAELALACGINRATAWRLLAPPEGPGPGDRAPATPPAARGRGLGGPLARHQPVPDRLHGRPARRGRRGGRAGPARPPRPGTDLRAN